MVGIVLTFCLYSLLGLRTLKNVKSYPTMTKVKGVKKLRFYIAAGA